MLEVDYVVIGAGATGMGFTDVVLTESDRSVLLVDRHAQPGGHWNHAYGFVRLHQPSEYYGVSSRELGRHVREADGPNEGMFEQATGPQVLSYFDDVMRQQFLPSGRVTYLPMSEYLPDGSVSSLLTGRKVKVHARRKIVDARYLGSEVPSVHTPSFPVAEGVAFIPVNGLTSLAQPPSGYVVLGGGKTSVDACVWLLEQGVDPQRIIWVRPHDLWLLNRARVQPDASQLVSFADLMEVAAAATDVDDLVSRLERADWLLRIDTAHWPTTFRGATASRREVELASRIEHVVRLGHVTSLEPGTAHLEHGNLHCEDGWVFVDCTAAGIRRRPPVPVFQPDRITLQYTMPFGVPCYCAALIARAEVASDDDALKNEACPALPVPNDLSAIAAHLLARLQSPSKLARLPGVSAWNDAARLNPASWSMSDPSAAEDAGQRAILRLLEAGEAAEANLGRLLEEAYATAS